MNEQVEIALGGHGMDNLTSSGQERTYVKNPDALFATVTSTQVGELSEPLYTRAWPDPTKDMLKTPEFEAVWQCIKGWDINVPDVYTGYMGATGNHVRAILDALATGQLKVREK